VSVFVNNRASEVEKGENEKELRTVWANEDENRASVTGVEKRKI